MAGTVGLSFAALGDDLLPITVALVVIVISSFGKSLINLLAITSYGYPRLQCYCCISVVYEEETKALPYVLWD